MIKLYDTKQRRKVELEPIHEGEVRMYVCGPTVYNRIHIGNARTFISFDTIRRYLQWRGYKVTFVQNITDVDDKIINKANEAGVEPAAVASEYTELFIADMDRAAVMPPDIRPRATEEIDSMISMVERLIDTGHAYEAEGDVYFSVRSYPGYGALSGRDVDEMESGHRELQAEGLGLEDRKLDPLDFAVWKAAKPGEPSWDSPWGPGRPGWHIECSVMAEKYLGLPFDIHGGGSDLIFPHHENERAQSEAACGCTFAKYWMHSGMLQINAEKMSKSLGNFRLLHEVLDQTRPEALRMLMLQTHYRSPLDFSEERLAEADVALSRMEQAVKTIDWLCQTAQEGSEAVLDADRLEALAADLRNGFQQSMDDDFNAPAALGFLFSYVSELNGLLGNRSIGAGDVENLQAAKAVLVELTGVLGIDLEAGAEDGDDYPAEVLALAQNLIGFAGDRPDEAVNALLDARTAARKAKDWAQADGIRDGLAQLGLVVEDTPQGQRIKR